ncbi:hypothetical protein G6F66_015558 [Rhizopus arrhizus]|nr:hypothetical protein G6F66_015558 [Rhizopus arrhizus]
MLGYYIALCLDINQLMDFVHVAITSEMTKVHIDFGFSVVILITRFASTGLIGFAGIVGIDDKFGFIGIITVLFVVHSTSD